MVEPVNLKRILVVTGGHSIDGEGFEELLANVGTTLSCVVDWRTQPEAQALLCAENHGIWDAVVLYDIAGLELASGSEPKIVGPSMQQRRDLVELFALGQGVVVLHHALASWPGWQSWAHGIGGRFHYRPSNLDGVDWPASGYRMGRYSVEVAARHHPVCDGIESFEVDDELYVCPQFAHEVTPLLTTDADLEPGSMIDAHRSVVEGIEVPATEHPPGSSLLGWCTTVESSPLVYLLPGHGRSTFESPMYRRLLTNAIGWVASSGAHQWAAANHTTLRLH